MNDDDGWWREPLTDLLAGRAVVVAGGAAAAWTSIVRTLRDLGGRDVLVVATEGRGAGPQPDAHVVAVDAPPGLDHMARIRHSIEALRAPPPSILGAVESFDPDRSALVLGNFLNEAPSLSGRPFLAHRRREWVALEDKTTVDALLDRADVTRADTVVVPVDSASAARHEVDRGLGTVWAADATSGYHGGASGTRWVVDDDEAAAATEIFAEMGTDVRVMPFMEGIPTSIHGIVVPDGIIVLRPVELVTLRRGHDLVYSGCATFWDPPGDIRDSMREAARRMGATIRDEVDFRGAFTLDGVATSEGFRPTELNPRFGVGLNMQMRGSPDLPLMLILDLVVAGVALDTTAADLEAFLLGVADADRAGGTWNLNAGLTTAIAERGVCYDGEWRWALQEDVPDAMFVGSPQIARASFEPVRTPVGQSVGVRSAAFWSFVDAELDTRVGALTAAQDVTQSSR